VRKQTRISARLLTDVAVFLAVTCGLLVLVEVGARVLTAAPSPDVLRTVEGDAVSTTLEFLDINLAPLDKDVDFLWRNRPNVEKRQPVNPRSFGRADEWTIVSNARGFRDVAPPPSGKAPDELRILCIGDSVTFGFNVDQAASYPEQLREALRARYGRPVRVINAGTPGWSWIQGVRFLEREGLALRPDVVVMAHGANDRFFPAKITDVERLGALERPAARRMEFVRLLLERTATYRLVQRWFAPAAESATDVSPGCRRQLEATERCGRVALGEIEDAVKAAARITRDAGVDLIVLNLDFEQTDAVGAVRSAVRQTNVPFVDVVSVYLQRRAADEDARAHALGLAPTRIRPPNQWREAEPTRVLFRVMVPTSASSVRVDGASLLQGTPFAADLRDDGAGGDEVAGDSVWSGRIDAPANGTLDYRFSRDGVGELVGLPPLASTQGTRKRQVLGETILPVEVFGDLYLMAERMHPNAAGQALIAESILAMLPSLPSFARWSGAGSD
jgi:lysophospholipase L1-like esterase